MRRFFQIIFKFLYSKFNEKYILLPLHVQPEAGIDDWRKIF